MRYTKVLKNKNATLFILEGLAMATALNMLGPFIQKFTERIGGNDWHIAMINSLPPLAAILFLIPCGMIINRIHNRKRVATFLLVFNSLFFIVMMIVPGLPANIKATVFVVVVGLMNWPQSLYLTTWQAFYSDTFRGQLAQSIYGMRSRFVALVGVFVVLITGTIIARATNSEKSVEFIYTMIFALCFVFTIAQAFLISKVEVRERRRPVKETDSFRLAVFVRALKDRKFMIFCIATFLFYLTWQMGWPIFYIYQSSKDFVGFDEFWFGLMSFCISMAAFLAYPFWTKKLTKWGTGPVMILGSMVLVTNPFLYLISTNGFWILGINTLIGAITPAFTMALFCRTIELAPERGKIVYFAVFNTIINISGFTAPLIGVWIKQNIGVINTLALLGFLRMFGLLVLVTSVYFSRTKIKNFLRSRLGN